jgi:hypothetical protein
MIDRLRSGMEGKRTGIDSTSFKIDSPWSGIDRTSAEIERLWIGRNVQGRERSRHPHPTDL